MHIDSHIHREILRGAYNHTHTYINTQSYKNGHTIIQIQTNSHINLYINANDNRRNTQPRSRNGNTLKMHTDRETDNHRDAYIHTCIHTYNAYVYTEKQHQNI